MTAAPRVLFIALDAAEKSLVLEWIEDGLLPNLGGLRDTGIQGTTANSPGVYTGSLWPSLWTGVGPGRHGCYYGEQLEPGSYEVREFPGHRTKREPFWNALSRAGRRMALIDVPKAPLSKDLNGVQLVDWATHDADVSTCSWPPALADDVAARYGTSPFVRCDYVMRGPDPERTLRDALLQRIEAKTAMACDLLDEGGWDLFMVAYGDSHCVGHQCWHVHDPAHPRHDPELAAALGDPVRDVYVALDVAVGRLLERAGPETTAVVLFSHGMGAHYDATFLIEEVLRRLEGAPTPVGRAVLDRFRSAWRRLPVGVTEFFGGVARRVDRLPDASDRARRKCFAVPTNANAAGVRLNLAGREPSGRLRPGAESDAFCNALIEDLRALVNPCNGRPVVSEVLRTAQLFPGEHVNDLPDLFVCWNQDAPISGVASPKIGRIERADTSTRRTGDHRPEGAFFARAPGLEPGDLPQRVDVTDFAPTVAALLGVALSDVDGQPLDVLCRGPIAP